MEGLQRLNNVEAWSRRVGSITTSCFYCCIVMWLVPLNVASADSAKSNAPISYKLKADNTAAIALSKPIVPPKRIVSLNLCLDQLLLQWVPRQRIQSVTYHAANPAMSRYAHKLGDIAINRARVEEIVPLQPDVVLAGQFGARHTVQMLEQLGVRVETFALPRTIEEVKAHLLSVGQVLGAVEKARSAVAAIEEAQHRAQHIDRSQLPTVLYYSPNGITVGAGTLESEMLQLAGFRNLAVIHGRQGFAHLSLEQLLQWQPDWVIVEGADQASFAMAQEYLQHPALREYSQRVNWLTVPSNLSVCRNTVFSEIMQFYQHAKEGHRVQNNQQDVTS